MRHVTCTEIYEFKNGAPLAEHFMANKRKGDEMAIWYC